jgi:hypothetical protein
MFDESYNRVVTHVASRGVGGNYRAGVDRDDVSRAGGGIQAREQYLLRLERGKN